jgi:hypothetical protein
LKPTDPNARVAELKALRALAKGGYLMNYTFQMMVYLNEHRRDQSSAAADLAQYASEKEELRALQIDLYAKTLPTKDLGTIGFFRHANSVPYKIVDPPTTGAARGIAKYMDATTPNELTTELLFNIDRFRKEYPTSSFNSLIDGADAALKTYAATTVRKCMVP